MNASTTAAMTRSILGGAVMVVLILVVATFFHDRYHVTKKIFYTLLSTVIIAVSVLMFALALNTFGSSTTGLLERRTAELSVSVCGQQLEFQNNSVLSQRVGGTRLYIHNNQIVAQSVITNELTDASLGALAQSLGGSITASSLLLPRSAVQSTPALATYFKESPSGAPYLELTSTSECSSGPATLNTFIYRYMPLKNTFVQYHVLRPESYVFTANERGQKGDCVVIEFAKAAAITSTTCAGYPASFELGGDL